MLAARLLRGWSGLHRGPTALSACLPAHTPAHTRSGPPGPSAPASSAMYSQEARVGVGVVCLRTGRNAGGGIEVLMIQRGTEPDKGKWTFPGGKLELGETIVGCAIRELKEETGISLRCSQPLPLPESSHLGVPLLYTDTLDTPVAFAAADAIVRDSEGNMQFHYAIIEVAGVPEDPEAPVSAADDAADAAWVAVSKMSDYDISKNCDIVAEEAARRFTITS